MLTAEEKKDISQKIFEKKREISKIQLELNAVNDTKEEFFKKKTDLSKKIADLIGEIKENRKDRNTFTQQVRQEKEERDKHNLDVKSSVEKIKELEKERDELLKKHNLKENPTFILKQISSLEFKIETQPMSFEEEKRIMKKIKGLKKQLEESKSVISVIEKINSLSREIDDKKRTAQQSHKKVQSNAKLSQEKHEALLETSTVIETLKKEEEEAFKNFIEHKKKFNELNEQLKTNLTELKELSEKVEVTRTQSRDSYEKRKKEVLEQKKLSVEEKLKKGMKLTTEDLLAFQGMDSEE
jgi:uncharacterized coiled-coil DUF342 family protein